MSEETGAAPSAEGAAPAADGGGVNGAPVTESSIGEGFAPEDVEALESAEALGGDTVRIGEFDVPIEALASLPDDVLAKISRSVKIDGEDVSVTLAEALSQVPLAKSAYKRMESAAKIRKQADALVAAMRENPMEVMTRVLGGPEAVYKAVADQLEYEGMTPEERARMDRERELHAKASRADEYERREQEQRQAAQVAKLRESYTTGIRGALEGAGVKLSTYAVKRTADVLSAAMRDGLIPDENITAADYKWAAEQVRSEIDAERSIPDDLDGDALIAHVGEETARRIARAVAAKVRGAQKPVERDSDGAARPRASRNKSTRDMSWSEFIENANRRMGIR